MGDVLSQCQVVRFRALPLLSKAAVIGAFAGVVSCFYFLRVADPDLWWHIKTGELIATTHAVPQHDTYSFTAPGARWTDHEWASHVIIYYVYDRLGGPGLTALKTLVGLGTAAAIYVLTCVPHQGTHLLVFLLASQIVARYALYRPQMVTYLFLALLLLLLPRTEGLRNRWCASLLIPALMVLWANLHGGFPAGLAVLAVYAAVPWAQGVVQPQLRAEQWPKAGCLAVVLVASTLVTLINPYGYQLWQALWHEVVANSLNRAYVQEWRPLWQAFQLGGVLLLLMAVLALVAFILRRQAWRAEDMLLAVATFVLSLSSIRNIPFFALVAAAPLARSLGAYMSDLQAHARARLLFLVAVVLTLVPALITVDLTCERLNPEIEAPASALGGSPSRAVAFLIANRVRGNLYNPLGWGGYLLWHLPPEMKISIDGRSSTVYPRDVLLDSYRFYANEAAPDLALQRGADLVLVPVDKPVAHTLDADDKWTAVYRDDQAVLFAGPSEAGQRLVRLLHEGRLATPEVITNDRFP